MTSSRLFPLATTFVIFLIAYGLCIAEFPNMLSTRVVGNLLTDNAFLGIAAVGMTFVILSGGIDLSIGSVIAFTGVFLAVAMGDWGLPPVLALVIVLVLTTAFGAVMGAMIHYLAMPPFIVTLAGMFFARGMAFLISIESVPIRVELYDTLQGLYFRMPGGGRLSFIGLSMIAVVLLGILIAHFTSFGRNVYAIGGNQENMRIAGFQITAAVGSVIEPVNDSYFVGPLGAFRFLGRFRQGGPVARHEHREGETLTVGCPAKGRRRFGQVRQHCGLTAVQPKHMNFRALPFGIRNVGNAIAARRPARARVAVGAG